MSKIELINGDCLKLVLTNYKEGMSMRSIAEKLNTNHKLIGRVLKRNGIETRKPLNLRGKRKFPCDIMLKYNNMVSHLKWNVSIKWAMKYRNFEKLKFLNRSITNRDNRYPFSTKEYKEFINHFYSNEQFNKLYIKWVGTNDKYLKPSIDHKIPRSLGGSNNISNLQFLTWFENRCKNNMNMKEWNNIKKNMKEYLL